MKKAIILLLVFLCLPLTGCMSRRVEEQLLAIVMGVDLTPSGDLTLTVKVPSNTGGSDGSAPSDQAKKGGNQMGYLTLSATGHQFADTMELLLATTPRSINFSQVQEVVISMELAATTRLPLLLQQLYALPRMRTQAALVVCAGEAKAFVEEQKPYVGLRLSRYIEVSLQNYAGKGFVPNTTLAEAVQLTGFGWRDPLLILGALPRQEDTNARPGNVLNVDAQSLGATSINAAKFYGAAATDGSRVSGTLTGYEMALIHMLRGGAQSLSLPDSQGFSLQLYARAPAALSVDTGNDCRLGIRFSCEVHYTAPQPPDAQAIVRRLETEIRAVVQKMQAMRCDGLGFGSIAVRRFLTLQAWEGFSFREKYCQAPVDVQVAVHLKKE